MFKIRQSLILFLLMVPVVADCASVSTCVPIGDPIETSILQKELDKASIPYRTERNRVCVASEYQNPLLNIEARLFPLRSANPLPGKVPQSPSGRAVTGIRLVNVKDQKKLEAELKNQDFWFTKDDTGVIWYETTHERDIEKIRLGNEQSMGIASEKFAVMFKSSLEKQSIKYRVEDRDGEKWFYWACEDDGRVQTIKKNVLNDLRKQ